MRRAGRNSLILPWIFAYLLVALLCLKASDSLIVDFLDNVTSIKLGGQARSDISKVNSEVKQLNRQVEQTRLRVETLASRHRPNLENLKALQSRHRLSLVQMERINGAAGGNDEVINYRTVLSGTVGAVVRFLKELEDQFLVQSDQVTLTPANDEGSQINLTITVQVAP